MPLILRYRLSAMMFLQYFMFGAWLVTLGTYMSKGLKFDDIIGTAYGMQGIAAVLATLVVGALADRYVSAQKIFGVLILLSGVTLLALSIIDRSRTLFLTVVLLHFMVFIPTIPLANAIALNSLTDPPRQFPTIRVLGTVGWIVAGLLIGLIPGMAQTAMPLQLGGAAGVVLAFYAFTLPDTPPRAQHEPFKISAALGLDFLVHMKDRNFWVFAVSVLLTMIPLSFYYAYCNNFLVEAGAGLTVLGVRIEPAAIQTLGQGSEFVFLLLLPLMLIRFGIKGVLLMGMLAWTLRYVFFAFGYDAGLAGKGLLIAGVLLHGVSYDFFFVASQLYVDKTFEVAARSRAQSFLVTLNMGLGVLLGANLANVIYAANTASATEHHWRMIWLIPAAIALVVAICFGWLFRIEVRPTVSAKFAQ